MPQLRPYKWMSLLVVCLSIGTLSLYFFNQVYLPRILAITRIRTYFRDLKVKFRNAEANVYYRHNPGWFNECEFYISHIA